MMTRGKTQSRSSSLAAPISVVMMTDAFWIASFVFPYSASFSRCCASYEAGSGLGRR